MTAQRYLLTVAYQAGPDQRIAKGVDGHRDFISATELEQAAFGFLAEGGRQIGLFHVDGTVGAADVVESYIYRGPDWIMTAANDTEVVVKAGDWLVGLILDDRSWRLYQRGVIGGISPQGVARRRAA